LDVLIGIFFFAELGADGLDILGDFNDMATQVILEILDADKSRTDLAGHKTFLAFCQDVVRERIHIDVFMTGKAFGLVVIVIHVPGELGF